MIDYRHQMGFTQASAVNNLRKIRVEHLKIIDRNEPATALKPKRVGV